MSGDNILYNLYERRLAARLDPARAPHHVGVILDGNRRWAKAMGFGAAQGHKRGADKIAEFLTWAEQAGVRVVTLWLLSTDNLSRDPAELSPLLDIINRAVEDLAARRQSGGGGGLPVRGGHHRPPLHQGPARPRPGDPHLR